MYAFIDRERHYYVVVGGFTMHRAPSVKIVNSPPRMEERYVPSHPMFEKVVQSFLRAAEVNGGDPIAINLLKEHYTMSKNRIFILSIALVPALLVVGVVGTPKKATEIIGDNAELKAVKTKEEFEALPEVTRLLVADLDTKVATLDNTSKLERAFEVLSKYEMPVDTKPRTKGVKSLIRDLFAVEGARHTVAEIVTLTGGTEVSVKTALSDLRSATYCKPGEPLNLTRLPTGSYALLSPEQVAAEKEKLAKEKADKEKADKEAKDAEKAKKAEEKKLADAAKAAEKPAGDAEKPAKKGKAKAEVAGGEAGGAAA